MNFAETLSICTLSTKRLKLVIGLEKLPYSQLNKWQNLV